jgi:streptogramin lyase
MTRNNVGLAKLLFGWLALLATCGVSCGAAAKCTTAQWSKSSGVVDHVKISIYSAPTNDTGVFRIATGSDGNLWFGEAAANAVVRFTTKGKATACVVTSSTTTNTKPEGLALGADGNIWFAEFNTNIVGKITPALKINYYTVPANPTLTCGMALGSNGDVYFATDQDGIGYISTKGRSGLVSTANNNDQPVGLGLGPDKNIWYIDVSGPYIGKITPKEAASAYQIDFSPNGANWGITAGPDGRIWFTDSGNARIGAINVDGTGLTFYTVPDNGTPDMIIEGPDGNLYFGEADGVIGRITTAGVVTRYPLPGNPGTNFPINGMAVGPDGNIWFANDVAAQVGVFPLSSS